MASFTVRVVLHDADISDYKKLYESMDKKGFSDIISSSDDIEYKMPDGEYNITGNYTKEDIRNKTKQAINETTKNGAVLVTKSSGRSWYNLDKI